MTSDDLKSSRLVFAGASALTALTWYALPDAVRSRPARGAIKAGLLGVTAFGAMKIPDVVPEAKRLKPEPRVDLPVPMMIAWGIGAAAAATAGTVWSEKAIFAYGERRRARGVRCAHTPMALALAVLSGASALVDWSRLLREASAD